MELKKAMRLGEVPALSDENMLLFHICADSNTSQKLPYIDIITPSTSGREDVTPTALHERKEFVKSSFPFPDFDFLSGSIAIENDLRTREKQGKEGETDFGFCDEGKGVSVQENSH